MESGDVDLVYSYSVFTHLPEPMINAWVAELARVLKPGGLLLTTILGGLAYAYLHPFSTSQQLDAYLDKGIDDSVQNIDLDATEISKDYYRNTFLTKERVRNMFEEYFDILEVIENFHFYQDLVVLKKK